MDKPTIQYVVEEAVASGIEDILIITGRNKRAIEDHFDYCLELELALEKKGQQEQLQAMRSISEMANIYYIRQKEPLGLGHAVYCARKFVGNEPFAVMLGDDIVENTVPSLKQLMQAREQRGGTVIGVQPVDGSQVEKYGIVSGCPEGKFTRVEALVEKPAREEAPSNLAVLGRYLIEPEIFNILAHTSPGAGGEIQLTDALNQLAKEKTVWAYTFTGRRYDVGDKLGFLQATVEYALCNKELAEPFSRYLKELSGDLLKGSF